MNINKKIIVFPIVIFLCLSSELILGEQKNNSIESPNDINQLQIEAKCIANTKQIRSLLVIMSEQESISAETLQKIEELLQNNLNFFKKSNDDENVVANLFGTLGGIKASEERIMKNYQQHMEDYSNFNNVKATLVSNVKTRIDINSFAAMVKIVNLLRPLIQNNAEWSGSLDFIIMDFVLTSPLTMIKYLDQCSQDEFDVVFWELPMIYNFPDKRDKIESELVRISTEEKKYTKTAEKTRSRMKEDCFKYYGDDAIICKD